MGLESYTTFRFRLLYYHQGSTDTRLPLFSARAALGLPLDDRGGALILVAPRLDQDSSLSTAVEERQRSQSLSSCSAAANFVHRGANCETSRECRSLLGLALASSPQLSLCSSVVLFFDAVQAQEGS